LSAPTIAASVEALLELLNVTDVKRFRRDSLGPEILSRNFRFASPMQAIGVGEPRWLIGASGARSIDHAELPIDGGEKPQDGSSRSQLFRRRGLTGLYVRTGLDSTKHGRNVLFEGDEVFPTEQNG
jgi:hypothetical protein